jgi:glutamine---fructose-6-phosphate transaminase (isomerizing)
VAERSSRFLEDILREPRELRAILRRLLTDQRPLLEAAARLVAEAPVRLLAGMGSSFHGGFAIADLFDRAGLAVRNADAGELLHFVKLAAGSVVVALSRSGRSIEVVELAAKAKAQGVTLIGVTNDAESPLARAADVKLLLGAPFDFNVSVSMYSGVALAGALIAAIATRTWSDDEAARLDALLAAAEKMLTSWQEQLAARGTANGAAKKATNEAAKRGADGEGVAADAPVILLARGPGLAAAHEARQLFEEAAKLPATAHSTGAFRHGPNEVVRPGVRVILWLAAEGPTRALDLALAADLEKAGAHVTIVGRDVPIGSAGRLLDLPRGPERWQFLVELMPVRLLIERIARARGVDCDTFRFCPFVVSREEGLGEGHGAGPPAPPAK